MKNLLLIITLCTPTLMLSQVNTDSLLAVWGNEKNSDSIRLKAISDLAWDGYLLTNPDSAVYYAQIQYEYAKKKGIKKHMAEGLNTQGVTYYYQGDFELASVYFHQCIEIYTELNDQWGLASTLNNIGNIYMNQGNYGIAIEYITKSLLIREEIGDENGVAASLNNIGLIYSEQKENEKALEYLYKSLEIDKKLGNLMEVAQTFNNLGSIKSHQGFFEESNELYKQSMKISLEVDDQYNLSNAYHNFGTNCIYLGDFSTAEEYIHKGLEIRILFDDLRGQASSKTALGKTYWAKGDYQKSISNYLESYAIAQSIGDVGLIKDDAFALHENYKKKGDYKKALEMMQIYVTMKDSIESEENKKGLIQQAFQYEYVKKAATDSVKNAEAKKVMEAMVAAEKSKVIAEKAKNEQHEAEALKAKQKAAFLWSGLVLTLLFGGFIFNRFRVTRRQKEVIEDQKKKVDEAYLELEEKNTEILDSINYARRIQSAILPPLKVVKEYLKESFILYKPKDVVAGDFYWMEYKDDKVLFAAADCTGHGVPGAMVSVVCNNGLNRSVREHGLTVPGKILDRTREIIIQEFEKSEEEVKDGMDISLCALSLSTRVLEWSGANNPLWIVRAGEIIEYKADKQPIGKYAEAKPFTTHVIQLEEKDSLYIFTDGYQDQFGGPKGKKFMAANLKKLLIAIQSESFEKQKELLDASFENWRTGEEQIDDVCVIGVRV